MELAVHEVISRRDAAQTLDLGRSGQSCDACSTHQHCDRVFADLDAHPAGELGMDTAGSAIPHFMGGAPSREAVWTSRITPVSHSRRIRLGALGRCLYR